MLYAVRLPTVWDTMSSSAVFNNHIGYSILARIAQSLLGDAEWVLRLPALCFGVLGVIALWNLSRFLWSSQFAVLPALLLCFAPIHVVYSSSVRGYSAMVFFSVVCIHSYLLLAKRWSLRRAGVFVIASALGMYFHLYCGGLTLTLFVRTLYRLSRRQLSGAKRWMAALMAIAAIAGLLYLPAVASFSSTLVHR